MENEERLQQDEEPLLGSFYDVYDHILRVQLLGLHDQLQDVNLIMFHRF
jgi:hypothetical protein